MPLSFSLFGRAAKDKSPGPVTWLIVGLGNPGPKYEQNRHNAGRHTLNALIRRHPHFRFDEKRGKGLIARGELGGAKVALVKPQTFMNLSGQAVAPVAHFYKVPPEQILVIYDDLDLPPAVLRLRPKGGPGGHKGMKSLIEHLGTTEFPRVRLGIGRPPGQMPVEAYVLQNFNADEWPAMTAAYDRAVDAVEAIIAEGINQAMNRYNLPEP